MTPGTAAIGYDTGNTDPFMKGGKSFDQGGNTPRHSIDIRHQDNGRAQPQGNFGAAPGDGIGIGPVK